MDSERLIPVQHETLAETSRVTQSNKVYTYKLQVLQQPIRARACGSGAKSSADRRPVDPPPIVELKIFEGEGENQTDITFSMNANYFLFATLEQARPFAHGRVPPEHASRPTVLTGTPVAGMVYLDRPHAAGYFIFPDLSVRHEGKYRLSFSLFEELKNPEDDDQGSERRASMAGPMPPAHVTHRLEVRSVPFIVYSAKKFPGLTESTQLSRVVAEQGCRVRIRRDVRMRRRDTKQSDKDWEGYEDETAHARARMSDTPEGATSANTLPILPLPDAMPRPRSAGGTSQASLGPPLSFSRRPSLQDLAHPYHTAFGTSPSTPQKLAGPPSPYLLPSPTQAFGTNSYGAHNASMHPPPPASQYASQGYYQQQAPPTGPSAPYGYSNAAYGTPMQQSHYTGGAPSPSSFDGQHHTDGRRASAYAPTLPPPPPTNGTYLSSAGPPPAPQGFSSLPQHGHHSSYSSLDNFNSRPTPTEPPTRANGAHTPLDKLPQLPPINTQLGLLGGRPIEPASPTSYASQQAPPPPPSHAGYPNDGGNKRGYGTVFNDGYQNGPLRQGARPMTPSYGVGMYAGADVGEPDFNSLRRSNGIMGGGELMLKYKRSNGDQVQRHIPPYG